jgi:hypothetical protein
MPICPNDGAPSNIRQYCNFETPIMTVRLKYMTDVLQYFIHQQSFFIQLGTFAFEAP